MTDSAFARVRHGNTVNHISFLAGDVIELGSKAFRITAGEARRAAQPDPARGASVACAASQAISSSL